MAFSHNLLGQRVRPKNDLAKQFWNGKANLSDQLFGFIRGVRYDEKNGIVEFMVADPHGNLFTISMDKVSVE